MSHKAGFEIIRDAMVTMIQKKGQVTLPQVAAELGLFPAFIIGTYNWDQRHGRQLRRWRNTKNISVYDLQTEREA